MRPSFSALTACLTAGLWAAPFSSSSAAAPTAPDGRSTTAGTALAWECQAAGIPLSHDTDILLLGGHPAPGELTSWQEATLVIADDQAIPLRRSSLAGLRGGGGVGRRHAAYFTDGTTLFGRLAWTDFTFEGEGLAPLTLQPDALDLMAFPTPQKPLRLPPGSRALALENGDQLFTQAESTLSLTLTGAWGVFQPPLEKIRRLWQISDPAPQTWVELIDGSVWNAWQVEVTGSLSIGDLLYPLNGNLRAMADSWENLQVALRETEPPPPPTGSGDAPVAHLMDHSQIPLSTKAEPTKWRDPASQAPIGSDGLLRIQRIDPPAPPRFRLQRLDGTTREAQPIDASLIINTASGLDDLPWHLIREIIFPATSQPEPETAE